MNRRLAISTLSGAALAARGVLAQTDVAPQQPPAQPEHRITPEVEAARQKARIRPLLCVYSGCLAKIPFPQLPEIVSGMGYDGIDLTVMKGGHVDPSLYMVQLDRAFQTFQDSGIELPMVSTSFTSASQPYAYAILYVSGQLGARFCRLGEWPPPPGNDPTGQNTAIRGMMMRADLAQFATTSQRCNITSLLANHAASYPGRSIPEMDAMLTGINRTSLAYCFDPAQAVIQARSATGWEAQLQAALPHLAAISLADVALSDAAPDKDADASPRLCPLGEGVIDWKKFFSVLAAARFHGPVSMHMDYETRNSVKAMRADLSFARARVEEAWPISPATPAVR